MRSTMIRHLALATFVVASITACSSDDSTDTTRPGVSNAAAEVTIDNFIFGPSSVTVAVGETVTWTNNQSITHTVTSSDELFDGTLSTLNTFDVTFDESGTFAYFCAIHPSMTGTVEVTG